MRYLIFNGLFVDSLVGYCSTLISQTDFCNAGHFNTNLVPLAPTTSTALGLPHERFAFILSVALGAVLLLDYILSFMHDYSIDTRYGFIPG